MKVKKHAWGYVVKGFKRGYHITASWYSGYIYVFGPYGCIDSWPWHGGTAKQLEHLRKFKEALNEFNEALLKGKP